MARTKRFRCLPTSKKPFVIEAGSTTFVVFRYRKVHQHLSDIISRHTFTFTASQQRQMLERSTRTQPLPKREHPYDVLFQGSNPSEVLKKARAYHAQWIEDVWPVFCTFCY